MEKEIKIKIETSEIKEAKKEISQLIELIKEANQLADLVNSKATKVKNIKGLADDINKDIQEGRKTINQSRKEFGLQPIDAGNELLTKG